MHAKDVKKSILTIVVVAIGIKIITVASKNLKDIYAGTVGDSSFAELINALDSLGSLVLYGLLIIAILLVPYYLSKRSQEAR